jgi:hypothetical protein
MPQQSLSQTPLFQHILMSLPSLRGQIKDAVTASTKQWLLEIRNLTGEVGKLALEAMENRTRRWRSRREKDPMLRLSRVGSAVETVSYETTDGAYSNSFFVSFTSHVNRYGAGDSKSRLQTTIPEHSYLFHVGLSRRAAEVLPS